VAHLSCVWRRRRWVKIRVDRALWGGALDLHEAIAAVWLWGLSALERDVIDSWVSDELITFRRRTKGCAVNVKLPSTKGEEQAEVWLIRVNELERVEIRQEEALIGQIIEIDSPG
jgi:hypothetical protein